MIGSFVARVERVEAERATSRSKPWWRLYASGPEHCELSWRVRDEDIARQSLGRDVKVTIELAIPVTVPDAPLVSAGGPNGSQGARSCDVG